MKTLQKYVFRSFLTSFFLAFLVLSFVLTIGLMVQIVGYILDGVPIGLVGEFALVCFPETMQWTIPLGLLVASVLVFSRMSADGEVAAMRACGVHLFSVLRGPIIFAALCTLFGLYVNNEVVPRGHEVRRTLAKRLVVGNDVDVVQLLPAGRVIKDFDDVQAYFERKEGNWLYGLVVTDLTDPKIEGGRLVTASRALVTSEKHDPTRVRHVGKKKKQDAGEETSGKSSSKKSEKRDIILDLYDVTMEPMDAKNKGMGRAGRITYVIEDALESEKYKRREKDFRFWEMISEIIEADNEVKRASEDMRYAHLDNDTERAKAAKDMKKSLRKHASELKTEFMKRWVFAFASICFVLVGTPLGIRAQRKESSVGMAISLVVALGYYLVTILMGALAKNADLHPQYLIWLPVVVCAALASYLFPRNL